LNTRVTATSGHCVEGLQSRLNIGIRRTEVTGEVGCIRLRQIRVYDVGKRIVLWFDLVNEFDSHYLISTDAVPSASLLLM
jgi:hypothetical protein